MKFKVDDWAVWYSPCPRNKLQAHTGVVVEVVPAGAVPYAKPHDWASPRNHESYLICEGKTLFWPRVKWFEK
jgi:hypothetical protein